MSTDDDAADRPADHPAIDPGVSDDRTLADPAHDGSIAAPVLTAAAAPAAGSVPEQKVPEQKEQTGPALARDEDLATDVELDPTTPRAGRDTGRKAKHGSFLRELPVLVVIALGLAILIKAFVIQAFYIPSGSMEQTLALNDRVLVNKVIYHLRDIKRGEVVVFNGEGSFGTNPEVPLATQGNVVQQAARAFGRVVGFGPPGERDFIKRVIGVPGDRVACCVNGHVTVQRAGGAPVELTEPYVYEDDKAEFCATGSGAVDCPPGSPGVLIPAGRLWVMGDHRGASSDSRLHRTIHDGTVPQDKVIGRAFVIVWPLDRFTGLARPATFSDSRLALAGSLGLGAAPYLLGAVVTFPIAGLRRRSRRLTGAATR